MKHENIESAQKAFLVDIRALLKSKGEGFDSIQIEESIMPGYLFAHQETPLGKVTAQMKLQQAYSPYHHGTAIPFSWELYFGTVYLYQESIRARSFKTSKKRDWNFDMAKVVDHIKNIIDREENGWVEAKDRRKRQDDVDAVMSKLIKEFGESLTMLLGLRTDEDANLRFDTKVREEEAILVLTCLKENFPQEVTLFENKNRKGRSDIAFDPSLTPDFGPGTLGEERDTISFGPGPLSEDM